MLKEKVNGSCLCGEVRYEITGNMGIFQYCHCSRCRKFTGSAYSANLFVSPEQFSWTKGKELVAVYLPEKTKYFSTSFCKKCGSSLPWKNKAGTVVVVPAGTLDEHPGIEPSQNIFFASRAEWYKQAADLPSYNELPIK
ncbi:MAG TPA: GFA family protein [Burkholderiales bacterium]|nr:GFA family protein [Burkholderiales bacterium]